METTMMTPATMMTPEDINFLLTLFWIPVMMLTYFFSIKKILHMAFGLFDVDPTNPYRRICRKCGDYQGEFSWSWNDTHVWWETLEYNATDPECPCHKRETYKSEFT